MRHFILIGACAFVIAACSPFSDYEDESGKTPPETDRPASVEGPSEPEPAPEPAPEPEPRRAEIDWNSARADFAAVQAADPDAMAAIASGPNGPPVPVILPPMASIASGDDGIQFRPLGDGYFALIRGETYDMLINGTDRLSAAPPGAAALPEDAFRFEETMTGAQVSFKRYGASYLVEFACKDPLTAVAGSCISEEDALVAVDDMLISGTQ